MNHNVLIESLFRQNAILIIVLWMRCGFERGLRGRRASGISFFEENMSRVVDDGLRSLLCLNV